MPIANHRSGSLEEVITAARETRKNDEPMKMNRMERKNDITALIMANVRIQLSCLYKKTGILQRISMTG